MSKFKRSVQELNYENFHDLVKPFSILIIDQSQDDWSTKEGAIKFILKGIFFV